VAANPVGVIEPYRDKPPSFVAGFVVVLGTYSMRFSVVLRCATQPLPSRKDPLRFGLRISKQLAVCVQKAYRLRNSQGKGFA
jgi:hypothetical protein